MDTTKKKVIEVAVRDKVATRVGDDFYVCGNTDYEIHFDFDEEWDALDIKTARFIADGNVLYPDRIFSGNVCSFPDNPPISNTNNIRVGVFAGNLQTTTPANIPAAKSILCGTSTPAAPEEDAYHEAMAEMSKVATEARTKAAESAHSAEVSMQSAVEAAASAQTSTKAAATAVQHSNNADTQAKAAAQSQAAAAVSAENAEKAKQDAIDNADDAEEAAKSAQEWAVRAEAHANSATVSADNAAESARVADASRSSAVTAAENANTYSVVASESAQNAAKSAEAIKSAVDVGEGGLYIVNAVAVPGVGVSVDRSQEEVREALSRGKTVLLVDHKGRVFPFLADMALSTTGTVRPTFSGGIIEKAGGNYQFDYAQIGEERELFTGKSALIKTPSPRKLVLKQGDVTEAEYDGSEQVTVEISNDLFVVKCDTVDGVMQSDRTVAEIELACLRGKVCIAIDWLGQVYTYIGKTKYSSTGEDVPTFIAPLQYVVGTGLRCSQIQVHSGNLAHVGGYAKVRTPNPKALTIKQNGVEVTYDGTEAVNISVEGGSGVAAQADWSQGNPAVAGYVKNRTHYAEEGIDVPNNTPISSEAPFVQIGTTSCRWVKVSEATPSVEQMVAAGMIINRNGTKTKIADENIVDHSESGYAIARASDRIGYAVVCFKPGYIAKVHPTATVTIDATIPEPGLYLPTVSSDTTYCGLLLDEFVKPLDDKYIPSTVMRKTERTHYDFVAQSFPAGMEIPADAVRVPLMKKADPSLTDGFQLYKISDITPLSDDLLGAQCHIGTSSVRGPLTAETVRGETDAGYMLTRAANLSSGTLYGIHAAVCFKAGYQIEGPISTSYSDVVTAELPEPGLYVLTKDGSATTITYLSWRDYVRQLPDRFIPSNILREDEIPPMPTDEHIYGLVDDKLSSFGSTTIFSATGLKGAQLIIREPWPVEIGAGRKYAVTYNGKIYVCEAVIANAAYGSVLIGNGKIFDMPGLNPDAPFAIVAAPNAVGAQLGQYGSVTVHDGAESVDISIACMDVGYYYYDGMSAKLVSLKELREAILSGGGTILEGTTVECDPEEGIGFIFTPLSGTPEVGSTYTVNWNGTVYDCPALHFEDDGMVGVMVGNSDAIGMPGGNPDAPFAMLLIPNGQDMGDGTMMYGMVVAMDGSANVTLSVAEAGGGTSSTGVCVVNITCDANEEMTQFTNATKDKTYEDVKAAYDAGGIVVARIEYKSGPVPGSKMDIPLTGLVNQGEMWAFMFASNITFGANFVVIAEDGSFEVALD